MFQAIARRELIGSSWHPLRRGHMLVLLTIPLFLCVNVAADVLTVDVNGGADYSGIQPAIAAAADGDTVVVKPGKYVISEPVSFLGKAIAVRGESGPEITMILMTSDPPDPAPGAVVVFENGEGETAVLEGFTLSGGREGGVYCNDSSPTLTNCTISGNSGGVGCGRSSSPVLTNCTISGNSGSGVSCNNSSPTLTNCTISRNSEISHPMGVSVGGVSCRNNSSPIFTSCTISGNICVGEWGVGGVYCNDSSPIFTNCRISGNLGGIYCDDSSPTLKNCTISGNSSSGVSCNNSSSTLTNCTISGNLGGGVGCSNSSPILTNCTISGNWWRGVGCWRSSSPVLTNCIVWGNDGESVSIDDESTPEVRFCCIEGEGAWPRVGNINKDPLFCGWSTDEVWVSDQRQLEEALGNFSLALSTLSPCIATGENGVDMGAETGVCDVMGEAARLVQLGPGTYSIEGLLLTHNVSLEGAGEKETVIEGTLWGLRTGATLSRLTVTKGTGGGIVINQGERPGISHRTISGNYYSGVICYGCSPILTNCTISGNFAEWGGGVYCLNNSSPTLTNCTISGNWADRGGGVCVWGSSPILTNCTISGNSANWGGGVCCGGRSSPVLTNCTISGNSADGGGGGVDCEEESLPTLTNCIVRGNSPESVCGNLSHCLTDRDPLFVQGGVFDFNRWRTVSIGEWEEKLPDFIVEAPDYHLQPGSPCIDTGTSEGAPTTDIEGNGRPCGAGVDMGAYELGGCPPPRDFFLRGDSNSDSKVSISDPVYTLLYSFVAGEPPTCLDTADSNDDGVIDIADAIFVLQYLFVAGPLIPQPYPGCGIDPTIDNLDCSSYEPCQEQ